MNPTPAPSVAPTGRLIKVRAHQLRPNPANPRRLFDEEPLNALKENIRLHGVLVPLTVYEIPGQDVYGILDGERRYICCKDLEDEGVAVDIPVNIVQPPDALA